MVRIIFSILLLAYGLIHLLGFVQAFRLTNIEGVYLKSWASFMTDSPKLAGTLWFLAFLLFLGATLLFILKKEIWWALALTAVVLSQILIILYWQEAKSGTIANGLIVIGIILGYSAWHFNRMVTAEINTFTAHAQYPAQLITSDIISRLPAPVQQWLTRSNIVDKQTIHTVYLEQKGQMRTTPEGKWMAVEAKEYFTVQNPGFLWIADVKAAPFIHLAGRDKYENGQGHMLIKALSLITVADAHGKETDQGTMLRYLGEMVWFPSAALSEYITWETIDASSARATMSYGGISAPGIFRFSAQGDVESFEAQRYYSRKAGATLEKWLVTIDKHSFKEFGGIRIPARSTVTWQLQTGDFTWFQLDITHIAYNQNVSLIPAAQPKPIPVTQKQK
ncbi:hypothetical protein GXP67_33965 [Rhodocytophaga rosea]|uniref:Uncharacterized protein n=1 Tax=Rhodocytophaga rosea TaxID=2704465 RepID=A0A6C0GT30_9BACT|nr:DUF6544 family protein [Rhodocytophaga rosea]QHT71309.1 hypothetical protein GXP67_33965 [Rhodocytophaga rosea]